MGPQVPILGSKRGSRKTLTAKSVAYHIFLQFLEPGCSFCEVPFIVQS